MTDSKNKSRRYLREAMNFLRWTVPGGLLLQLTNCSTTNTDLIVYQYEVAARNLVVNLIGTVLSAVI